MADTDQSLYNLRYNQVTPGLEGFGGGTPQWTPLISGSGMLTPPAGADTQIQYNNMGAFGASPDLTFEAPDDILTITGTVNAPGLNLMDTTAGGSFITLASAGGSAVYFANAADTSNYGWIGNFNDLTGIQIQTATNNYIWNFGADGSLTPPSLVSDPATPVEGSMWYNGTSHTWRGFDGTNLGTFTFTAD